ncbi:MAG: hypothetical protein QW655_02315 [Nitrososphaerota archaeon]
MEMNKFILGLSSALAILTLGSIFCIRNIVWGSVPLQVGLMLFIREGYSLLIIPLSSALGAPSLGGGVSPGIWPLLIWIFTAFFIGFMIHEPGTSAKIILTSAMIVFASWIFSVFISYPLLLDNLTWMSFIDKVMSDLLFYRLLDIIFLMVIPPIASSIFSLLPLVFSKLASRSKKEKEQLYEEDIFI